MRAGITNLKIAGNRTRSPVIAVIGQVSVLQLAVVLRPFFPKQYQPTAPSTEHPTTRDPGDVGDSGDLSIAPGTKSPLYLKHFPHCFPRGGSSSVVVT